MEKKVLLEQIKRMHEIIGVNPNIMLETELSVDEAGVIPGTSKAAQILAKVLVSDVIEYAGTKYTKAQVRAILNKIGLKALSKEESEVVKIATSRVIAKDAAKSVLDTIAKTFVADLKAITDDAVAAAEYQEFKNLAKTVLKSEDLAVLEKNIKKETDKIVRPIKPQDLTKDSFEKLVKSIDGSKLKNYSDVTNEMISTYRAENPNLATSDLIKKILADCPNKTWTTEFIMKHAGAAFDFSTEKIGQFIKFIPEIIKKIPAGKTALLGGTGVLVYIAYQGIKGYGKAKNWEAFKEDLTKIIEKYPCLGDTSGNPMWVLPDSGNKYFVKQANGSKLPAVWEDDVLYYIDKKTEKKLEPVAC